MEKDRLLSLTYNDKLEFIFNNEHLDIFVNDIDSSIRREVAKQGYGLEKLISDKDKYVRCEVAYQGYGLDIIINDKDIDVREEVIWYCRKHQDKEECKKILTLYNL